MPYPFKDELFNAQWLRTAGHAHAGGADLGECLAAAGAIRDLDTESWRGSWLAMADRLADAGRTSLAAGRRASAYGAFLRASNYYRSAYVFLIGPNPDSRLVEAYRRHREAFRLALSTRPGWGEAIDIPYEGKALPGYVFAGAGPAPRPTLIVTGGYDSTAEEAYFYSGAAACERGYNFVCFDGPGQGAALIEDAMTFRPDWENVVAPVLEFLRARRDVDPHRIALMGLSFGGYLAPRAASGNPSLAACIADPGQYSILEEARTRLPGPLARQLPDGSKFALDMIDALIRLRLRHPTKGWAIRRGLWVHGVERPIDYLRLTAQYTMEGRADLIRCPTLVTSAQDDAIGATGRKLFDLLTCPRTFLPFRSAEGAGAHCEAGARALFNQRAFDWVDPLLEAAAAEPSTNW